MALPLRNPFLASQWLRAAGHAAAGGADLAECFQAADRIREREPQSWHDAWLALADRVAAEAERSAAAGSAVSAHAGFLRAANYARAASLFLMQREAASGLRDLMRRQRALFAAAGAARPGWSEPLVIPYAGTVLHGHFFPAQGCPRGTVVMTGGYDSPAEEAWFFSGAAAVARGYNFVSYDGPGQGRALVEDGLLFRPDWEVVMAAVLEAIRARPDVRGGPIVSMGLSFGGYLAPRAATGCAGLAALIADPGQFSVLDEARARMPPILAAALPDGNRALLGLLARLVGRMQRDPIRGWAIRRGLYVHGVDTPLAYFRLLAEYTSAGRVERIRCPAFIGAAEGDDIGVTAARLYDALPGAKTFQQFLVAEAAGAHCETGARLLFNQRAFDWLDRIL